jgi:hypothetical protein
MVGCSTEAHLKGLLPDVYGQLHPVETPELIARKRVEFEDELKRVPDHEKICLMQAEEKCPELLTDDFKLMFLRCEVFQAKVTHASVQCSQIAPDVSLCLTFGCTVSSRAVCALLGQTGGSLRA